MLCFKRFFIFILMKFISLLGYCSRICHCLSNCGDKLKANLLAGNVTHVAFMARTFHNAPLYISVYDLENKNILYIFWNLYIMRRTFKTSEYIPVKMVCYVDIEYSLTTCRDSQGKRHMLISVAPTKNPNALPQSSFKQETFDMVYCNVKVDDRTIDATKEVAEILDACKVSKCVLAFDTCALILRNFYHKPRYANAYQQLQIMDSNTFEEHIFKAEDLVQVK